MYRALWLGTDIDSNYEELPIIIAVKWISLVSKPKPSYVYQLMLDMVCISQATECVMQINVAEAPRDAPFVLCTLMRWLRGIYSFQNANIYNLKTALELERQTASIRMCNFFWPLRFYIVNKITTRKSAHTNL